jgi:hypothetical protein
MREPAPTIDLEDGDFIVISPPPRSVRIASAASRAPRPLRVAPAQPQATPRESVWQVAGRCAEELAQLAHASSVLIHRHDPNARELRVIAADGDGAHELLGTSTSTDDDTVFGTIRRRRSFTMCFERALPSMAPVRVRTIRARRSLVAVPVVARGALVAVIEVYDADEHLGIVARESERIADRLAEAFLD